MTGQSSYCVLNSEGNTMDCLKDQIKAQGFGIGDKWSLTSRYVLSDREREMMKKVEGMMKETAKKMNK